MAVGPFVAVPTHQPLQREETVVRHPVAGGGRPDRSTERHHALRTRIGKWVAQFGLALRRVDTHGLRCDRREAYSVTERWDRDHIDGLGNRVKVDWFTRTDDEPSTAVVAEDSVSAGKAQPLNGITDVGRCFPALTVTPEPIDCELPYQGLAVLVDVLDVTFNVLIAAGRTALLIHHVDVLRREVRDVLKRLDITERFAADQRHRHLGVELHQLESRTDVLQRMTDGGLAAPGDEFIEVLRTVDQAFDRSVTAAPVSGREGPHGRMARVDVSHRPQDRSCREQIVGWQFEQVNSLGQCALDDAYRRRGRPVAGHDVDKPRWKCPDMTSRSAGLVDRHPAVDETR